MTEALAFTNSMPAHSELLEEYLYVHGRGDSQEKYQACRLMVFESLAADDMQPLCRSWFSSCNCSW